MRPFGEGVPVRPTTRSDLVITFRRARKRFACGLLKLESSSITTMSNGQRFREIHSSTSQTTRSRLIT